MPPASVRNKLDQARTLSPTLSQKRSRLRALLLAVSTRVQTHEWSFEGEWI